MEDECGVCGGDGYASVCVGTDGCDDMDCSGNCDVEGGGIFKVIDECGVCGGINYASECIGTDDCANGQGIDVFMDCAGNCNGDDRLTPCGDCSNISNCNFSVDIIDSDHTDNNFKSDNIQIPISLNGFNFVGGFDALSPESEGFEGVEFIVNFDSELLEFNSANSISLLDGFGYDAYETSPGEISAIFYDSVPGLVQSMDGPIVNLSFDVIDAEYTPALHGSITEIQVTLIDLNSVDISEQDITDIDTLTIYTKACIDPFASILNPSNFICDVDERSDIVLEIERRDS